MAAGAAIPQVVLRPRPARGVRLAGSEQRGAQWRPMVLFLRNRRTPRRYRGGVPGGATLEIHRDPRLRLPPSVLAPAPGRRDPGGTDVPAPGAADLGACSLH